MDYLLYNMSEVQIAPHEIAYLNAEERESYKRRGKAYLTTRVLLKKELARRCHTNAADISFTYNEYGKPLYPQQHFNISHSGEWLCLAFHSKAIGVDIQQIRPVHYQDKLARRIMSPRQWELYQERGCQTEDFFTCWCIAESLVKLRGLSVWNAQDMPFEVTKGRVIVGDALPHVQVDLFSPAPGYCGAISLEI